MATRPDDGWNAGDAYERFMGRWSRPLSEAFVRWLSPVPGRHWLDVGTGTGALAAAICSLAQPASVIACDPSASLVDVARLRVTDSRVRFETTGVDTLPRREGLFDAVVSGLAFNFFPRPATALEEQLAVTRRGGSIAAFVWDYVEGMEFLRVFWDGAREMEPRAAELDEGRRFPMCAPHALEALFESGGLEAVQATALEVPTVFSDFEDYWEPFLGGAGPAPSFVASLAREQREALREDLRKRLRAETDGSIRLRARAWAVRGRKP